MIGFNVRNCDFQSSINVSLSCVFLCLSLVITGELFVIIRVFRRGFLFLFLSRRREEREEGGGVGSSGKRWPRSVHFRDGGIDCELLAPFDLVSEEITVERLIN